MLQITDTEIYRNASSFRGVSPFEDRIDYYKSRAYEDHEALIELEGRPTREVLEKPAREKPAWTVATGKAETRTVAFHENSDRNVALDRKLRLQHWSKESKYFDDELTRWKEFRLHQQTAEHHIWLKIDFDPSATDPRLANILVKLNDWREFQNYQRMKIDHYALSIRRITQNPEDIVRDESASREAASHPNLQYLTNRGLDRLFELQMGLESSETLLTWIEGQITEILAETSATLEADTSLQRRFETELEQQAYCFHQELLSLEARPDHSVQTPSHSLGFTQRICHWGLETTRLMKDLWEWRVFLKWQRTNLNKSSTSTLEGQASNRPSSHIRVWVEYVAFRQYELDRTRTWVKVWQRMLPEKKKTLMTTEEEDLGQDRSQSQPTSVLSYVKAIEQDVHTAETRLRSAEQQLAQLSSQLSSQALVQGIQNSTKPSHSSPYIPDSESSTVDLFKGLTLDSRSIFSEVHQTVKSIKAPACGAPDSAQSSCVPEVEGERRILQSNITKRQAAIVSEDTDPIRFPVDDDICMTDTCEAIHSPETVEEGADTASSDDDMGDDEDDRGLRGWIITPDVENCGTLGQRGWITLPEVKNCSTREVAKLPSNNCKLPSSRQTRSATKQNDILSSRTPMKIRKQSSKKAKPRRARTLELL